MDKITVRIIGGLGNQLHGYAFGICLSKRLGCSVIFDCESGYWDDPYGRQFLLDEFPHIKIQKASLPRTRVGILVFKLLRKLSIFLSSLVPLKFRTHVLEGTPTRYRPDIFYSSYVFNPYFMGYWASYRYLQESESSLRRLLQPPEPKQSEIILRLVEKLSEKSSSFIHYRSYQEEKMFSRDLRSYYCGAVNHVLEKDPAAKFYVFSDNVELARRQLTDIGVVPNFIDLPDTNTDLTSLIDFALMCSCEHSIIGDSTFSWWAAWLNNKPNQIVVSPGGISAMGDDWVDSNWEQICHKEGV
jgi:hypothetical protein